MYHVVRFIEVFVCSLDLTKFKYERIKVDLAIKITKRSTNHYAHSLSPINVSQTPLQKFLLNICELFGSAH